MLWHLFVKVQMNTLWMNTYGWLLTFEDPSHGTTTFSKVQILNARCGRNPFSWKESDSPLSVSWNGRMLGRGLTTVTETFSVIITIVNVNGKVMHRKWWIVMKRGVPALTSQNISSNLFEIFWKPLFLDGSVRQPISSAFEWMLYRSRFASLEQNGYLAAARQYCNTRE